MTFCEFVDLHPGLALGDAALLFVLAVLGGAAVALGLTKGART